MSNQQIFFSTYTLRYVSMAMLVLVALLFGAKAYADGMPVVMLSVNGGDTDTISLNDQEITLEWYVENVTSCTISPDVGSIPVEPTTGSIQIVPPQNDETQYTLSCDGFDDSIVVLLEPTTSIATEPTESILMNPADFELEQSVEVRWNSERADYCTDFTATHQETGITKSVGPGENIADPQGSFSLRARTFDRFTRSPGSGHIISENGGGLYTFSVRCVNQFSGEADISSVDLRVIYDDMGELDFQFTGQVTYTPEPGYDYVGARVNVWPINATDCGIRTITSPNRNNGEPYIEPGWARYGYRGRLHSHGRIENGSMDITEDTEFSITCWQDDPDGNRVAELTRTHTFIFEPLLESDGTVHDPWTLEPSTVMSVRDRDDRSIIEEVYIDPVTGVAPVYARFWSAETSRCYRLDEYTEDGWRTSFYPPSWSRSSRYVPRDLATTTTYYYTAECGRIPSFPPDCNWATVGRCEDAATIRDEDTTSVEVLPPTEELMAPSAVLDFTQLTPNDAEVSEYEFTWNSDFTTQCTFRGYRENGNLLTLSSLQSVDAISGSANQSFTSSGETIEIVVECSRPADNLIGEASVTITLPGDGLFSSEATAEAIVVTGECFLDGTVVSVPTGYYTLEGDTVTDCLRFVPDMQITRTHMPNPSILPADGVVTWQYNSETGQYDDVPLNVQYTNVSENAYVFSNENVRYGVEIGFDQTNSNDFTRSETLIDSQYTNELGPGQFFEFSDNITLPIGQHILRVWVEANAGINSEELNERFLTITIDPPEPDVTLETDRSIVRIGDPINVSWEVSTVTQASCVLQGIGLERREFSALDEEGGPSQDASGDEVIRPQSSGIVQLTCVVPGIDDEFTAEQRIEVVAPVREM